MTDAFRIDCAWLPREYGDEVDRVTLAEISMPLGSSRFATTLEDVLAKTVRSSARLSAVQLAEWFACNWWRLCWEPWDGTLSWRMSHKMSNIGGGYVWPDVTFSTDWEAIQISVRRTDWREGEPVRYLEDFDFRISLADFEMGIDGMVDGTIARLASTLSRPTQLSALWDQVSRERRCPERSEVRQLEACMGYDPGEAPAELIDQMEDVREFCGSNAMREVAAVSKDRTVTDIRTLQSCAASGDSVARIPDFGEIRPLIMAEANEWEIPWRRGATAAKIARKRWGLNGSIDTATLSELFSVPAVKLSEPDSDVPSRLSVGLRRDDSPGQFGFLSNRRHPHARRFAFVRLVADNLTSPDSDRLLPATDSRTVRQKFQRAFAQEFLCPIDELKARFGQDAPTGDAIDEVAEDYAVSPRLVEAALVNSGILDRETLGDRPVEMASHRPTNG